MLYSKKDKERFFSKVNKTPTCWEWTAGTCASGYGAFSFGRNNTQKAHRISYVYFKGEIPEGLVVRHKCNNPSCVNPKHLVLGTKKENGQDRKLSGKTAGKRHYKAKKRRFKIWNDETSEYFEFDYQFEAVEKLNISSGLVCHLLKGRCKKTSSGYRAEYLD